MVLFVWTFPRRVNPTGRSSRLRSVLTEFLSDSDPNFVRIRRNPMKFGSDLVGFQACSVQFRQSPGRNPTGKNPTKTLSDPIEIISIRRNPITPQPHGFLYFIYTFITLSQAFEEYYARITRRMSDKKQEKLHVLVLKCAERTKEEINTFENVYSFFRSSFLPAHFGISMCNFRSLSFILLMISHNVRRKIEID